MNQQQTHKIPRLYKDPVTGFTAMWRNPPAGYVPCEAGSEDMRFGSGSASRLSASMPAPDYLAMLRAERNARLAATDYMLMPDYPITEERKAQVITYRQALRDLTAQDGCPWDGGGEATPWPELEG